MANLYVNDSGTWRNCRNVYVNDGGTWRDCRQIYVNDAGTWRTVFASTFMPDVSCGRNDGGTPATLTFTNTGLITGTDPGPGTVTLDTWTTDPVTSDYEMFITVLTGSFSSGTTGAWVNLGSDQVYTRGAAASTTQTVTFTIDLRRVTGSEAINTASGLLECAR